jgi:hypothetical protein
MAILRRSSLKGDDDDDDDDDDNTSLCANHIKYLYGIEFNGNINFDNIFTRIISPTFTMIFSLLPIFKINNISLKLPASVRR